MIKEVTYLNQLDKKELERLHNRGIKYILTKSTGTDHIDCKKAKELGITVVNIPGYSTHSVAEFYFKQLHRMVNGEELKGKKLGIIGYGDIGKRCGDISVGYGMQTHYYDIYLPKHEYTDIIENCEIIFICCPLTQDTKDMINLETLYQMKKCKYLLNMTRDKIVNYDDILNYMNINRQFKYAVDDKLPVPQKYSKRILSTNHKASKTPQAQRRLTLGLRKQRIKLLKRIKRHEDKK